MAIDLLKYMIWKNSTGGGGASYEKTVGPASIISISDAKPKPAKSLIVGMEPIQSGSGDPSPDNIRPISGRTGLTAWRTGKNLFNKETAEVGFIESSSGKVIQNISYKHSDYINVFPDMTYSITNTGFRGSNGGAYYDINKNYVGEFRVNSFPASFTVPSGCYYMRLSIDLIYLDTIQLELGTTTTYEPYVGASYPVSWQTEAGTVYGGTVDVVSGVLTVELASVDLGSLSWTASTAYTVNRFDAPVSDMTKSKESPYYDGILCSAYDPSNIPITAVNVDATIARYNGRVYVCDSRYATAEDFTEGVSGVQFVYELDEPQTYQLTQQQIQMLKGANTLWSDADNLTLTYIGTTPENLLGGMLGGGFGNPQEPEAEPVSEETEALPDEQEPQE